MKKLIIIVTIALCLGFGAKQAYAVVPTIDGLLTVGNEWDGYLIYGADPNEGTITDNWDISAIYMKVVTGEVSGNGLYFRMDSQALPTFTGGPGSSGGEAFFQFYLDYDGDLAADKLVDLNDMLNPSARIAGVYTGPGLITLVGTAGTTNALSSIIEVYVPDTLLSTTINPNFGLYARLDNKGDEPDDRLPLEGFLHPVPEPGSMLLLGMGILGLVGLRVRKKA